MGYCTYHRESSPHPDHPVVVVDANVLHPDILRIMKTWYVTERSAYNVQFLRGIMRVFVNGDCMDFPHEGKFYCAEDLEKDFNKEFSLNGDAAQMFNDAQEEDYWDGEDGGF